MNRTIPIIIVAFLLGAGALQAEDRRAEKIAREHARQGQPGSAPAHTLASGWLSGNIEDYLFNDFRGITTPGGRVVWMSGRRDEFPFPDMVWRSIDGGASWQAFEVAHDVHLTEVAAIDADTAMVGTFRGQILRTTNGGTTWNTVFAYGDPDTAWMDGVRHLGGDTVIAFGDADELGLLVVRSTDAGASWTRLTNLPEEEARPYVYSADSRYRQAMDTYGQVIWLAVVGESGAPRIVKSTDGGDSWSSWAFPLAGGPAGHNTILSVNFQDGEVGYVVTGGLRELDYWMRRTTDGGATFSNALDLLPGVPHLDQEPRSIKPIRGTNLVVALGSYQSGFDMRAMAWLSTDRGGSWEALDPLGFSTLTNAAFLSENEWLVIGPFQAFKRGEVTDVAPAPDLPVAARLEQNYPNPFNPATTIEYNVGGVAALSGVEGRASVNVKLAVYDLLGREIAVLVNEPKQPGQYQDSFDGSGLAGGVYIYRLTAGSLLLRGKWFF